MIHLVIIALTFIWSGLVIGISFVETPLKFKAPGITRKLGLSIGKIVFSALNGIEIIIILLLLSLILTTHQPLVITYVYLGLALIVLLQTVWLLPALKRRIDDIMSDRPLAKSHYHAIYGLLEISKLVMLFIAGIVYGQTFVLN